MPKSMIILKNSILQSIIFYFFFATDRTLRIVGIVKIGITKMKLTLAKIAVG